MASLAFRTFCQCLVLFCGLELSLFGAAGGDEPKDPGQEVSESASPDVPKKASPKKSPSKKSATKKSVVKKSVTDGETSDVSGSKDSGSKDNQSKEGVAKDGAVAAFDDTAKGSNETALKDSDPKTDASRTDASRTDVTKGATPQGEEAGLAGGGAANRDGADEEASSVPEDIPRIVPRNEAGLDRETLARYHQARDHLRQAERELKKLMQEAQKNPIVSGSLENEHRAWDRVKAARNRVGAFDNQYRARGDAALNQFRQWQSWYGKRLYLGLLNEMAAGSREQPLLARHAEGEVRNWAINPAGLRPDLRVLLPARADQLVGDKAIKVFLQIKTADVAGNDCSPLEKDVAPSQELKEAIQQRSQEEFDFTVSSIRVGEASPPIGEKRQERSEVKSELFAIWPRWSKYERDMARRKSESANANNNNNKKAGSYGLSDVRLMLVANAILVLILGVLVVQKRLAVKRSSA